MWLDTSVVPAAACCTLRAISCVAAPCSSTAEAMAVAISLISPMVAPIDWIAATALAGGALHRGDLGADLLGRLGGLVGQALDLGRHHGEALAGLAGARRLDGGVERQQIGLAGDVVDQADHLADLLRGVGQALDHGVGAFGLVDRLAAMR